MKKSIIEQFERLFELGKDGLSELFRLNDWSDYPDEEVYDLYEEFYELGEEIKEKLGYEIEIVKEN